MRWEAIDDARARLVVPFGREEDAFTVTFDARTGLLRAMVVPLPGGDPRDAALARRGGPVERQALRRRAPGDGLLGAVGGRGPAVADGHPGGGAYNADVAAISPGGVGAASSPERRPRGTRGANHRAGGGCLFLAPAVLRPAFGRTLVGVFFLGGALVSLLYTLPTLPGSLEGLVATASVPLYRAVVQGAVARHLDGPLVLLVVAFELAPGCWRCGAPLARLALLGAGLWGLGMLPVVPPDGLPVGVALTGAPGLAGLLLARALPGERRRRRATAASRAGRGRPPAAGDHGPLPVRRPLTVPRVLSLLAPPCWWSPPWPACSSAGEASTPRTRAAGVPRPGRAHPARGPAAAPGRPVAGPPGLPARAAAVAGPPLLPRLLVRVLRARPRVQRPVPGVPGDRRVQPVRLRLPAARHRRRGGAGARLPAHARAPDRRGPDGGARRARGGVGGHDRVRAGAGPPGRVDRVVWPRTWWWRSRPCSGGVWLWRRQALGYLVAATLLVKGGFLGLTLAANTWLAAAFWGLAGPGRPRLRPGRALLRALAVLYLRRVDAAAGGGAPVPVRRRRGVCGSARRAASPAQPEGATP